MTVDGGKAHENGLQEVTGSVFFTKGLLQVKLYPKCNCTGRGWVGETEEF